MSYWLSSQYTPEAHAWINSSSNLLDSFCPPQSLFLNNLKSILSDQSYITGSNTPSHTIQKILGLLESAFTEFRHGMLHNFEYTVFSEAFDDFLDHAEYFHKCGKKNESAILSSIIFEDTIKKIAKKNNIDPSGLSLEPLITELSKAQIFTPVATKRIKGFSGLRNHTFHAEWDKFEIGDVGEFIKSLKKLIEDHLS
jgi:hypothetical protein